MSRVNHAWPATLLSGDPVTGCECVACSDCDDDCKRWLRVMWRGGLLLKYNHAFYEHLSGWEWLVTKTTKREEASDGKATL